MGDEEVGRPGYEAVGPGEQEAGEEGVGGEQALARGRDGLHQVLEEHGEIGLGLGSLRVGVQTQALHDDQVAAVEVAAAPVGHGVAQALAHRPAGLIGGQLQALGVDGEVLAAVLFRKPLAALGQLVADAPAESNVLPDFGDLFRPAEGQAVVPQPLFVGLHGPGQGVGRRDGVQTQLVQLVVPAQNQGHVVVEDAASQQGQGLQLGALDGPTFHLHGAGAFDGAGHAPFVDQVEVFGQGLAVDLLKVFISALAVILGGEHPPHLHGADQAGGAHPGELVAGEGVFS